MRERNNDMRAVILWPGKQYKGCQCLGKNRVAASKLPGRNNFYGWAHYLCISGAQRKAFPRQCFPLVGLA